MRKVISLIAALFICAALWSQEASDVSDVHDVGGIPDVSIAAPITRFFTGPVASDPSGLSASRIAFRPASAPVYGGPLMPGIRASSFGWGGGIWNTAGRMENEADPLIDVNVEGLWHLPYLGNALALGYNVSWKGDFSNELSFMVFGVEAEGRYYIASSLPFWVGLRAGPTYYLLSSAGVSDTLRILAYLDAGVSYPLGSVGLEVRGTAFLANVLAEEIAYGFGLSFNYAFLKGR